MMSKEELIASLKKIIAPYVQDHEAFGSMNMETNFIDDLKVNSAHLIDIVLDIEDHFDITVENEELDKMTNVGAAIALISTKLKD